jgi:hypothetical protein
MCLVFGVWCMATDYSLKGGLLMAGMKGGSLDGWMLAVGLEYLIWSNRPKTRFSSTPPS